MEDKLTKEDCIVLIKNKFNENNELPRDDKKLLVKQEKQKRAKERKAQYKKNCEKNNEE